MQRTKDFFHPTEAMALAQVSRAVPWQSSHLSPGSDLVAAPFMLSLSRWQWQGMDKKTVDPTSRQVVHVKLCLCSWEGRDHINFSKGHSLHVPHCQHRRGNRTRALLHAQDKAINTHWGDHRYFNFKNNVHFHPLFQRCNP